MISLILTPAGDIFHWQEIQVGFALLVIACICAAISQLKTK